MGGVLAIRYVRAAGLRDDHHEATKITKWFLVVEDRSVGFVTSWFDTLCS